MKDIVKVSDMTESLFAYAVALSQSGRLRNTIHAYRKRVLIYNMDHTLLLHFLLSGGHNPFSKAVNFEANDYDSPTFYQEGDKIIFQKNVEGLERKKMCNTPDLTFDQVFQLYKEYYMAEIHSEITFHKNLLSLLDESLSHLEIVSENKKLLIIQRDIYTGNVIKLKKRTGKGLEVIKDKITRDLEPIGLRTNDFIALFTFSENITLKLPKNCSGYCILEGVLDDIALLEKDPWTKMTGILSQCKYDDLGTVSLSIDEGRNKHGREK